MQNQPLCDEGQWVATLFQKVLDFIKELEFTRQSPSIFLVYAHDSETDTAADAAVAQKVIRWLKDLDAHLYSDRSPDGNYFSETRDYTFDPKRAQDILSSQLCLLPNVSKDTIDCVILCGSVLLGDYLHSKYYQNRYLPELKSVYTTMQEKGDDKCSALSNYINTQVEEKQRGFHHVLTELAFLELGVKAETTDRDIVPFLLNGNHATSFPKWLTNSTTIRIEDAVYREPGYWKGDPTYQDQGLHLAFFKLLKRLWPKESAAIQIIEEEVYTTGLRLLQQGTQCLYQSDVAIQKVITRFRKEAITRWRADAIEAAWNRVEHKVEDIVKRVLEQHVNDSKREVETQLREWYRTLADRTDIQRVSGATLPMECCYINLGVVEYQPKQAEEEKDKLSNYPFYRLQSAESINNTNTSDPIALDDLFKPRRLKSGETKVPKRILIRGRAGIGKTTLAKKSMHDHILKHHWAEHFDYVLWIRLRDLKGRGKSYSLETLLYDEYFEEYSKNGHDLAKLLHRCIKKDRHRTLFVLDGWDEIAEAPWTDCLRDLVKHPAVIITSRPHGVSEKTFKGLDLELETIGFSEANVMAYLDHPDIIEDKEAAKAMKAFIQERSFVRELVNIPIQLDALCYSWEAIKERPETVETMTGLYQVMMQQLWRKDIVKLGKKENGVLWTKEQVERRPFSRLGQFVREEVDYLEILALNGLYHNQIEFSADYVENLAEQLRKENKKDLASDFGWNIAKLSCLQVERAKLSIRPRSYQFLHLTFQEFFSAQSLAKAFSKSNPLSLLEKPGMIADSFIREHKYDPRYEIVWWLVAGILEGDVLIKFFELLDEEPQDLVGIQHQYLVMHCLRESHNKLPENEQKRLRCHLSSWLELEMIEIKRRSQAVRISLSSKISYLGSRDVFPESLLISLLKKKSRLFWMTEIVVKTLGERHSLSHSAIHALTDRLQDTDPKVRWSVAEVLAKQTSLGLQAVAALVAWFRNDVVLPDKAWVHSAFKSNLAPEFVQSLMLGLQDEDSALRERVAKELSHQSNLTREAVEFLVERLQDIDPGMREAAARALGNETSLADGSIVRRSVALKLGKESNFFSQETLEALIDSLQDIDLGVRKSSARSLGGQSNLPRKAVDVLVEKLEDADSGVRAAAADSLEKQPNLALETVETLIVRLQDANSEVSWFAGKALAGQSNLAPKAVKILLARLRDTNSEMRALAAYVLISQANLAPETVEALMAMLQDGHAHVRKLAADVLSKQANLAPEIVKVLVNQLQSTNPEVRDLVLQVLTRQSSLILETVQALVSLFKHKLWNKRHSAVSSLARQSNLDLETVEAVMAMLHDGDAYVKQAAVMVLGRQSSLAKEHIEAFLPLCQNLDPRMRQAVSIALGNHLNLALAIVEPFMVQLEDVNLKREVIHWMLKDENSWNVYGFLPIMGASFLKVVYSHWILSSNFMKPASLYLQSGSLHFYTPEGLKTVPLNAREVQFKQAILEAQKDIGIPVMSQIRAHGSSRRQSSEPYESFFPMPGAWPVASQTEYSLRP